MPTFDVKKFDCSLEDDGNLQIVEGPKDVTCTGPFFYCDATVECTIETPDTWHLGFVQVCDEIDYRISYATGNYAKWEFPTPISDYADYPYYNTGFPNASHRNQAGKGYGKATGKAVNQSLSMAMNDNLNMTETYEDDVPPKAGNAHVLNKIKRSQKFTTYLVASPIPLDQCEQGYSILARCTWQMDFTITFDCNKKVGQRLTGKATSPNSHKIHHQAIGPMSEQLPACVFAKANANGAQVLNGYDAANTSKGRIA